MQYLHLYISFQSIVPRAIQPRDRDPRSKFQDPRSKGHKETKYGARVSSVLCFRGSWQKAHNKKAQQATRRRRNRAEDRTPNMGHTWGPNAALLAPSTPSLNLALSCRLSHVSCLVACRSALPPSLIFSSYFNRCLTYSRTHNKTACFPLCFEYTFLK